MTANTDDAATHAAITETIINYAKHVDTGDSERWGQLFCEDAVFNEGRAVQGRANIEALLPELLGLFSATAHYASNISIDRTAADRASSTSYVYAAFESTDSLLVA